MIDLANPRRRVNANGRASFEVAPGRWVSRQWLAVLRRRAGITVAAETSAERRRLAASKGGTAVHALGLGHNWTSETARRAARTRWARRKP